MDSIVRAEQDEIKSELTSRSGSFDSENLFGVENEEENNEIEHQLYKKIK